MTRFDAEERKLGDGNRRARRDAVPIGFIVIVLFLSLFLPLCLSFSFCVSLSPGARDDNDTQTLSDLFQPARPSETADFEFSKKLNVDKCNTETS